ncbi:MAG: methyltransferase domain-containing protein [Alphaproteobacteria bacterium]|nr:methyltransferase domain-containing protein [Alphaproteobacteria bacterium]
MAAGGFDRKAFWEHKILGWERGRYREGEGEPGLLQRIADWSSDSLRFRIPFAAELLTPFVEGRTVVDLGCGSGLLTGLLLDAGAAHVRGIDIAESAIVAARARAEEAGWGDRASFEVGTTQGLDRLEADFIVSLGLTDWLTDDELDHLFALGGQAHVLHAYSELRASPSQLAHRAYCWASYGLKTGGYVPRYFSTRSFARRLARRRPGPVHVVHHPRLAFGALITSLPIGEQVLSGPA